jgi:ADP-ribose pyrophosphatase YjhB (NUDIX family)
MKTRHRNPFPTVDVIVEINEGIVLVNRANPPYGWALPGGFVDYGESLEACAIREAREETMLDIALVEQFHTYSDPSRDPRHHSVTTVYICKAQGKPKGADDARAAEIFELDKLPEPVAFDHSKIIHDYSLYRQGVCKKEIFQLADAGRLIKTGGKK